MTLDAINNPLLSAIRQIVEQARYRIQQTVNSEMVQAYWHIGRLIVEDEQRGQQRAIYGKQQLRQLSEQLTREFGKGFDTSNLRNMRSFYLCFPKCDALRHKLSWTHYRLLIRVENPKARDWYMQETLQQKLSLLKQEKKALMQQLLTGKRRVKVD